MISRAHGGEAPPPRFKSDHFVFYAPSSITEGEMLAVADRAESTFVRTTRFLGRTPDAGPIRFTLFRTLEEKGLKTGYTLPAHAAAGGSELYAALEPGFDGEIERVVAGLVILRVMGRPRTRLLEMGLEMYFTTNWRGRGYRYWAGLIGGWRCGGLDRLLNNRVLGRESRLVARPLAASFVAWAIEEYGRENLLEKYRSWRPAAGEVEKLEKGWNRYLESLRPTTVAGPLNRVGDEVGLPVFQKGFCHAHEGYQIDNGYISRRSDEALEKLARLGVNAISLTPFTYISNPTSPSPFPFSRQAGAENDESIIHAVMTARRLGFAVMIKPHIWVRGGWPGDVNMATERDWDLFFGYYWNWIRHYAVLARMYDVEILCLGVELSGATIGHESRWQEIARGVRWIYGGPITYAANWGEELEGVSFWGAFDFIGVNFYYPLSQRTNPTDADLRVGADRALDRVDGVSLAFGKPVILTEVGFTSTPAPWVEPYERDRGAPADELSQARCYQAICDALSERSTCAGVYWWKWPSDLSHGGAGHTGYTPNGKTAEEVFENWFAGLPSE
jgi:hypothetical protein